MIPGQSSSPLFSIVVPTYNAAPKLRATLDSVVGHRRELCEIIVVDGASTDDTPAILAGYGDRLRILSEPDRGVYDAMNKGIALARGRVLYFLGAGDRLRMGALETIAQCMPTGELFVIYGDIFNRTTNLRQGGVFSATQFRRLRNVPHQAIFYSRAVFDRFGPYDLRYRLRADNVINMRAWTDPGVSKVYNDTIVADFEGGGLSDTQDDAEFVRDFPRLVRETLGLWQCLLYRIASVKYSWAASRRSRMASGYNKSIRRKHL